MKPSCGTAMPAGFSRHFVCHHVHVVERGATDPLLSSLQRGFSSRLRASAPLVGASHMADGRTGSITSDDRPRTQEMLCQGDICLSWKTGFVGKIQKVSASRSSRSRSMRLRPDAAGNGGGMSASCVVCHVCGAGGIRALRSGGYCEDGLADDILATSRSLFFSDFACVAVGQWEPCQEPCHERDDRPSRDPPSDVGRTYGRGCDLRRVAAPCHGEAGRQRPRERDRQYDGHERWRCTNDAAHSGQLAASGRADRMHADGLPPHSGRADLA